MRRLIFLLAATLSAYAQPAASQTPKFGISIHWGLHSILAGEWNGQPIAGPGEEIMRRARIPVAEYEKLAAQFNPSKFNADAWVKWAQDSGVQVIVASAKDPDGFAMFHSTTNKYNVFDATPFHRDPLKELQVASAKRNIPFGVSYSLALDAHEPAGGGSPNSDSQIQELVAGYGPLRIFSFGPPLHLYGDVVQRFVDMVHAVQPSTLVSCDSPPELTVQNINQTAGFKKSDNSWKSSDELIFKLIDTASKGGTYLLNVGPTADGSIPQPVQNVVREIGDWLKVNGDAVNGALPTSDSIQITNLTKWRSTRKPGKLFITMFEWPSAPLQVAGVEGNVTKAYLLADPSHKPLSVAKKDGHVEVSLPAAPAHVRTVVVLETQNNAR